MSDDASWGIVEAATIVMPELFGIELPDYLGIDPKDLEDRRTADDEATWRRYGQAHKVYRSLIEMLPYRDAQAVTGRTIEMLNAAMHVLSYSEMFRTMFQIAPQPDNRLNAEALHGYLLQFKMPTRDASFGFAMFHELSNKSGPVATLARWAAGGPYPTYDSRVVELGCIPLVWLLSSSNRFLRDWVTKALVQLLRGHLDVMQSLVARFWEVDDPYVVQRVMVIAYGALMRRVADTDESAALLVSNVLERVFTAPIRADELLLDAARGIVQLGVYQALVADTALERIQRPYGLKPPSNPPKKEALDAKYGFREDQPADERYTSIYYSVIGIGDFGRYVIESGLHHFSRYRVGAKYPEPVPAPERRFVRARWQVFARSLTKPQKAELAQVMAQVPEDVEDVDARAEFNLTMTAFEGNLEPAQQKLYAACWQWPRRRFRDDEYPADRAKRWVVRRTIDLGWTPEVFASQDRTIDHRNMREAHKAERWGKKYQWIAYHELLARVADNYQSIARRYDDDYPYEGLYQITAEREIDPSLPPVAYREFNERDGHATTTWPPSAVDIRGWPPAQIDFTKYGSAAGFVDISFAGTLPRTGWKPCQRGSLLSSSGTSRMSPGAVISRSPRLLGTSTSRRSRSGAGSAKPMSTTGSRTG